MASCPQCKLHYKEDHGVKIGAPDGPQSGDMTICPMCYSIVIFDTSLPEKLRMPTPKELEEPTAQYLIQRVQEVLAAERKNKRMN